MTVEQSIFLYYFIIFFTFLLVSFSELILMTKYRMFSVLMYCVAFIFPWFVASNRFGIGTDYFNYVGLYKELTHNNNLLYTIQKFNVEPGWIFLNYIVKYIFSNVQYLFVISSFLTLVFFFMAIYRYKERISMGISIFILFATTYNLSFNITRQTLAMAILLFSIKYIEEKKLAKFLACVILAASFHYTSLLYLPIYWLIELKSRNWDSSKKVLFYLTFLLFIVFFDSIVSFMSNISDDFSKYSSYQINSNSEMGFGNIIIRFPLILIILINYKRLKQKDPLINQLTNVYFISVVLYFLSYLGPHLDRIAFYYEMTQILIFPCIVRIQQSLLMKYSIFVFITLYYILDFTSRIIINNSGETIPYVFKLFFK